MEEGRSASKILQVNLQERDKEGLGVDGRTILECILKVSILEPGFPVLHESILSTTILKSDSKCISIYVLYGPYYTCELKYY